MTDAPAAAEPTREEGRRSPSTLRRMVRLGILPAMAILLALVVGALVMIASSPLVRSCWPWWSGRW